MCQGKMLGDMLQNLSKQNKHFPCSYAQISIFFFSQIRDHDTFPPIDYTVKESLCLPFLFPSFFFGQADPRFVWNKNLLEELIEAKVNIYEGFDLCLLSICILAYVLIFLDNFLQLDEFIIPLIQGNIQNKK